MYALTGSFAPVPTPLTTGDRFDAEALQRHLRWLARRGLDGCLVMGSNGEFPSFTQSERQLVAEAAVAAAEGTGLTLILNVGSCALAEVLEQAALAARSGYHGILCPPPFYFRSAPPAGLVGFFRRLLDTAELPVLLYHIPQLTGVPISDELLAQLGDHPRLAGVKDSSGDPRELARLCARFRSGSYLVGHDRLVTRALQAGGKGSISAAASIAPELLGAVARDLSRQGELDTLRAVLDEHGPNPSVKAVLRRLAIGEYSSRPPLQSLDADQETRLFTQLAEIGFSPEP